MRKPRIDELDEFYQFRYEQYVLKTLCPHLNW